MVDLHRTFRDKNGSARQGLSEKERLQVGQRWLRWSACALHSKKPLQALHGAVQPSTSTCRAWPPLRATCQPSLSRQHRSLCWSLPAEMRWRML